MQMQSRSTSIGKASGDDSPPSAPYRGPSPYQSCSQYYNVLNHFLAGGLRVRRYARFKRIGDKRGWGPPEWIEGLELDRATLIYGWDIAQPGARLAELVFDGAEIVSYQKPDPPHGMVTYILVSWPSNAELERNRAIRTAKKRPKQRQFPRSVAPFQRPQTSRTSAASNSDSSDCFEKQTGERRPGSTTSNEPEFELTP